MAKEGMAKWEAEIERMAAEWPDLGGVCGYCSRSVDNSDPDHRVTPIVKGGRGVECRLRGDFGDDEDLVGV